VKESVKTIFVPLIVALIGGGSIGYFVKDHLDKRRELISEVNKERREVYQQTADLIISMFANIKSQDSLTVEQQMTMISRLYDIYKKNLLYASPEVINAFADFMQYSYQNTDSTKPLDSKAYLRKLSILLGAMRTDLGLDNDGLGSDQQNLLRVMITDFDQTMN